MVANMTLTTQLNVTNSLCWLICNQVNTTFIPALPGAELLGGPCGLHTYHTVPPCVLAPPLTHTAAWLAGCCFLPRGNAKEGNN